MYDPWALVDLAGISLGLYLFIQGCRDVDLIRCSRTWPFTNGTVTQSEFVRQTSLGDDPYDIYRIEIEYVYSVDGKEYEGDALYVGGILYAASERDAEKDCARYPVGATVKVWYDPMKPEISCLIRSGPGAMLYVIFGLAFIVMSVLALFQTLTQAAS